MLTGAHAAEPHAAARRAPVVAAAGARRGRQEERLGAAKVDQLQVAGPVQQQVLGLEVPVDDLGRPADTSKGRRAGGRGRGGGRTSGKGARQARAHGRGRICWGLMACAAGRQRARATRGATCSAAPHGTAPHSIAPHRTAPHPHSTAQHPTAAHCTARHCTAPHRTAQHSTEQHSTAPHSAGTSQRTAGIRARPPPLPRTAPRPAGAGARAPSTAGTAPHWARTQAQGRASLRPARVRRARVCEESAARRVGCALHGVCCDTRQTSMPPAALHSTLQAASNVHAVRLLQPPGK